MNFLPWLSFDRIYSLILACVFVLPMRLHAATELHINGIDDELKTNVELFVGMPPGSLEKRKLRRYISDLPTQTLTALSALGYYAAEVDVSSELIKTDTVISIDVVPNEPVLIKTISINITGVAENHTDFQAVLGQLPITEGITFVSGDYEASKAALFDYAQDLGYFKFAFSKQEVRVSRRKLSADIILNADSGPRYTFGDIVFEQDVFSQAYLQRWVPFASGDPYESGLIGELTQNLQNSGYFKSVRVVPLQDRRYGFTVPVRVDLRRKDNNQVALGVGFATDTRLRTRLTWARPLLNRYGHSADWELGLSAKLQDLTLSYRVPRKNEPLYNYWGANFGIKNESTDDTDSFLGTINFERVSRTPTLWTESLFIRWERERFEAGTVEEKTTDLLLPGFSYSRSRSKGNPFPIWGQASSIQLMGGSKRAFSSIDFLKSVASYRHLHALSDRNTLIGAFQYGAIQSNDYSTVPVSQRFFAGGDRSIRGYKYRDLSPLNPDGKAIGGRYLEVLNLEYNYRFLDTWSAAVFADAGRAFNSFSEGYNVGAGVGIRWQSPVGPFRVDIATPIDNEDHDGIRLHLSLGPDL